MTTDEIDFITQLRPEVAALDDDALARLRANVFGSRPSDDVPGALSIGNEASSRRPMPALRWAAAVIVLTGSVLAAARLRSPADGPVSTASTITVELPALLPPAVPSTGDTTLAGPAENYLFVGTDSRIGTDSTDADYGGIVANGDTPESYGGSRSDTMLVLRYDPATRHGVMVSLPRDLRVTIADTGQMAKLNSAIERADHAPGILNLIRTVQNLGIPINHYVEVDLNGFKQMVDAIGGVRLRFLNPVKDLHTGLDVPTAACITLNGVQARQYVRSRYLEVFRDGQWETDGSSDIGRMARQQDFLQRALNQAISQVTQDPSALAGMIRTFTSAIRVDPSIDVSRLAQSLHLMSMSQNALESFTLPNQPDGEDLVIVNSEAAPLLARLRGEKATDPTTAPTATTAITPRTAVAPGDGPFVPVTDC